MTLEDKFWEDVKEWLNTHPEINTKLKELMEKYDCHNFGDVLNKIPGEEKKPIIPFNRFFCDKIGEIIFPPTATRKVTR